MSASITEASNRAPADERTTGSAVATTGGRATFLIGGGLFVASGIVAFLQTPLSPLFDWAYRSFEGDAYSIYSMTLQYAAGAFAALAMIVFAIGTRDGGSVVARRPVGMIALILFALWPYVSMVLWTAVPYDVMAGLLWGTSLIPVAAGLVAVIEIVRIRAVPGVWRWLPAIAYLFIVGPQVLVNTAQDLGWNNGEAYAPVILIPYGVFLFAIFIVPFVLGLAAIGLAVAARRRDEKRAADPPASVAPAPVDGSA